MKRVLVCSANGKVGRRLPAALDRRDLDFRLFSRNSADDTLAAWHVRGDLDSLMALRSALDGCDQLFFALPFSETMPSRAERLLGAAREAGIRHIVRLSAWRAGELPHNEMAVMHGDIDDMVRASGIGFTILRCNSFWQNLTEMYWPVMVRTGVLALPEGDAPQAFIDTTEIASKAADIFAAPQQFDGQTLDLAGPETLSYSQALTRLNSQHGTNIEFQEISEERARHGFEAAGLSARECDILLSLAHSLRRGDMDPAHWD